MFKMLSGTHNSHNSLPQSVLERTSVVLKNVTRPTVSLEPFRKIIIDLSPLSQFLDKISFVIEFQNVSKHCI